MRILWITENYPPQRGGMAQSCDRIVANLRKRDVHIDVVHFTNKKKPFESELKVMGSYTALPKTVDMAHGLNLALTHLEQHFAEQSDLIVAFGGVFPMTAIATFSAVLNIPYYLCLRGNDFDIGLFSYKKKYLLDQAINNAQGIFVNSFDKIRRIEAIYNKAAYFTPNSIDLETWTPLLSEKEKAKVWREKHLPPNVQCIGLFGFLKEKKGVLFFLQSLVKSGTKKSVFLLFSGTLEAEVEAFLNAENIEYLQTPFLERIALLPYYLMCDWVVIPSFYEGMPNVLLEAGALHLPIVASAIDGMKDVIKNNQTGWLFQTNNTNDCAEVIRHVIGLSQEQRKKIGAALFADIKCNYTLEKESNNYLNVFKNDGF